MAKLPFPDHIEIELTNACNLSCKMCPRGKLLTRVVEHMPLPLVKKILDECTGKSKSLYLHQFGETLLYPWLIEAIGLASKAGLRTLLSTNCTLLRGDLAKALATSELDEIVLCIDSLDKAVYESIRVGASFETVLDNIKAFLAIPSRKPEAVVQMIELPENEQERSKFLFPGADRIVIKPYTNWAGMLPGESEGWRDHCHKLDHCLTIQLNGNAVLCCRDLNGVTKVGNVNDTTILEIWNSYGQLSTKKLPFCEKC